MTSVTDLAKERKVARLIDRLGEHIASHPEITDRTFAYLAENIPMNRNDTVIVSLRVPRDLLADIDAIAQEMAYHEGRRINRNSLLIEMMRCFVEERKSRGPQ